MGSTLLDGTSLAFWSRVVRLNALVLNNPQLEYVVESGGRAVVFQMPLEGQPPTGSSPSRVPLSISGLGTVVQAPHIPHLGLPVQSGLAGIQIQSHLHHIV